MKAQQKRILFLTGTRADYGKLKPLMQEVNDSEGFECKIFATGMHTLEQYGFTVEEIRNDGFKDIYMYVNQIINEPMEMVLANTVHGLGRYVHDSPPDMIIVHGDRVEAMAGAIVGSLRNILTGHIEGGEISGTVDELMRHAVSKLSHVHFVANEEAAGRLRQMGEEQESVFIIGSPDIDAMVSENLPTIKDVKSYYEIPFNRYGISIFHPVTNELEDIQSHAQDYFDALEECGNNHVIIYPNNDEGTTMILKALKKLENSNRFRCLPSLRFEYFLTLLKEADYIVGNSSAAIREAPVYGVPTVNVGSRQKGRFESYSIVNVSNAKEDIKAGIEKACNMGPQEPSHHFGTGESRKLFGEILNSPEFFSRPRHKQFRDFISAKAKADEDYVA